MPAGFAMDRYAYYVCFKCGKAYFGGEARCDIEAGAGDTFNPEELVCGGCSDVSQVMVIYNIFISTSSLMIVSPRLKCVQNMEQIIWSTSVAIVAPLQFSSALEQLISATLVTMTSKEWPTFQRLNCLSALSLQRYTSLETFRD